MSPTPQSTTSSSSPFLALPAELRQKIYTHLLTTPHPIRGPIARGTQTYSLHTSILRTSRLLHTEARPVFLSHNTFVLTSLHSTTPTTDHTGSGAFEPPLQLHDLPLVRSLEIDVLFYPSLLRCLEGRKYGGWTPVCPAAERYVASLVGVLGAVEKTLVRLRLGADTTRFVESEFEPQSSISTSYPHALPTQQPKLVPATTATQPPTEAHTRKLLTGFHMLDRNPRFRAALAKLHRIPSIALHFDFAERRFDFDVQRDVLCALRFVPLAEQVLARREEMRTCGALREEGEGEREGQQQPAVDGDGDVDMESKAVKVECLTAVLECYG